MTLPRDARMLPAIRQIAERVAQCAGYSAAEAMRFASGVGQAAETVVTRLAHASGDRPVDVRFEREANYLDVWLRYEANQEDRPGAVDPTLSSEVLRNGLESVEFGSENGFAYCHLRRTLPREKVDHRCEMPPDGR